MSCWRSGQSSLVRVVRGVLRCWPALLICWMPGAPSAQENAAEPPPYTISFETNLIQIPVLVLTPAKKELRFPVAANRFSITLDKGAPFRPKFVRSEGEDPINLAIVVDARSPQADLLPKMNRTIADLAPAYLHAQDRVSIYVIDCSVLSQVENIPADPAQLMMAADRALSAWTLRKQSKAKAPCDTRTHLWDFLAHVTNRLAQQPGWRVLLAVTNGDDRGSEVNLNDLANNATYQAVTIFGLNPIYDFGVLSHDFMAPTVAPANARPGFGGQAGSVPVARIEGGSAQTKLLSSTFERTGGLMMTLGEANAAKDMQQMIAMLRNRYVLEFPRPDDEKAGSIAMFVKIDGTDDAFIRPAGDGVPVANPPQAAKPDATAAMTKSPASQSDSPSAQEQTELPAIGAGNR